MTAGSSSRDRLVYTVEEAAGLLGVARSTMYELVRLGEVPAVRIGRRLFVTAPTITALTGVTPPPPAELAARRAAESLSVDPRPSPSEAVAVTSTHRPSTPSDRDADAQPSLFG